MRRAAESQDPVVQQLIARRDIAARNGDAAAADAITTQIQTLGWDE